jgi:SAM-dependent methyltransferase
MPQDRSGRASPTERTRGVRAALSAPQVYLAYQRLIGARKLRTGVLQYLRPRAGDRLLDIGCGPGELSAHLPSVDYVGFDLSERYIAYARAHHGDHGTFFVGDVAEVDASELGRFDLVLAHGVLHHVDDAAARRIFAIAAQVLRADGRMVTVDGCYDDSQSRVAHFLVAKDRGPEIRTVDGYRALAETAFGDVVTDLRHDLLRVPYSLAILEASVPRPPAGTAGQTTRRATT